MNIDHHVFHTAAIHAVLGQNGSGKSTLLSIIGLLLKPTSGTILFDGRDVYNHHNTVSELRPALTTVIQNPVLFDTTVEKNIEFGLRIRGTAKDERATIVDECLGNGTAGRISEKKGTGALRRRSTENCHCQSPCHQTGGTFS